MRYGILSAVLFCLPLQAALERHHNRNHQYVDSREGVRGHWRGLHNRALGERRLYTTGTRRGWHEIYGSRNMRGPFRHGDQRIGVPGDFRATRSPIERSTRTPRIICVLRVAGVRPHSLSRQTQSEWGSLIRGQPP